MKKLDLFFAAFFFIVGIITLCLEDSTKELVAGVICMFMGLLAIQQYQIGLVIDLIHNKQRLDDIASRQESLTKTVVGLTRLECIKEPHTLLLMKAITKGKHYMAVETTATTYRLIDDNDELWHYPKSMFKKV